MKKMWFVLFLYDITKSHEQTFCVCLIYIVLYTDIYQYHV